MENQNSNFHKEQQDKKSQLKNYAKYSGLGFQMIGTMLLGYWIGTKLDAHFQVKSHLFTIFCLLFGVISSIYFVIRGLMKGN